jgi:hypothetical protein
MANPATAAIGRAVRTEALALIKANNADFGPTLACEKLAERHAINLDVER